MFQTRGNPPKRAAVKTARIKALKKKFPLRYQNFLFLPKKPIIS
jgi:hypothetical protein